MADIFISYASEDRDRIKPLIENLLDEGWSVWWDRELQVGPRFARAIQDEIDQAGCVIVLWSEASVQSDWVHDEANEGRQRGILVPVMLDDIRPPMGFRSLQMASLVGWPESRGEFDAVLAGIRECLGVQSSEEKAGAGKDLEKSIAVLPFVNLSDDPQQDYFSDGLTEDITTDLALIPELFVIARSSTHSYKSKSTDVRQVGRELGVRYVLEGSVRTSGNSVRVTAQLIEAVSGHHLWAKRYDRDLVGVFSLQDELTKEIVTALDVKLISGARGQHQRNRFTHPEAGEALYRGIAQFYLFHETSNAQARVHFEMFTQLEPDSTLGYEWLAQLCQREVFLGWGGDSGTSLRNMGACIEKAMKINDRDPMVLGCASMHQLLLGKHDKSIDYAKQALVEAPGMDSPYYTLGWSQMFNDMPLEGIENLKLSMKLSPVLTAPRASILGTCYRNAGQYELAVFTLEDVVKRFPAFISGRVALVSCYSLMGKAQEAKQAASEVLRLDPTYTITRYTTPNRYRDKATMKKWAESLRKAGIPE